MRNLQNACVLWALFIAAVMHKIRLPLFTKVILNCVLNKVKYKFELFFN